MHQIDLHLKTLLINKIELIDIISKHVLDYRVFNLQANLQTSYSLINLK